MPVPPGHRARYVLCVQLTCYFPLALPFYLEQPLPFSFVALSRDYYERNTRTTRTVVEPSNDLARNVNLSDYVCLVAWRELKKTDTVDATIYRDNYCKLSRIVQETFAWRVARGNWPSAVSSNIEYPVRYASCKSRLHGSIHRNWNQCSFIRSSMFPIVASAEELIKTASASLILISNCYTREDV